MFDDYLIRYEFVGADMARKFLMMGWTRARRYANHRSGKKYDDNGRIKAQLANRDDYTAIIGTITEYLEQNPYLYEMLLVIIVAYLP